MSEPVTLLYPLLFSPVLKDYIWGGRNLASRLGRDLPPGKDIAESWEIAAHTNGDVLVSNGLHAGKHLSRLTQELGIALVGSRGEWALSRDKFPLLVKLLDANKKLSVQVHPQDPYAQLNENNELGKTEMWVVLHAEPHAAIILGVKEHTTPQSFRQALEKGELESQLHELPLTTGDFVCVPSGSLHAILEGLLIAEVQQNSDVTYRVYDWNRVGDDGKARALHVDRAMDVINFEQREPSLPRPIPLPASAGITRWQLCRNEYFVVERLELTAGATFTSSCSGDSLEIWGALQGAVTVDGGQTALELAPVTFTLLPAQMGPFSIAAGRDVARLLRVYLQ